MKNKILFSISFLTLYISVFAQGGTSCNTATNITQTGVYTADNSTGDRWFQYTNQGSQTALVVISSCALTSEDTYLSVFSNCTFSQINSSDDFCQAQSQLTLTVNAGQTIYFVWDDLFTNSSFRWSFSTNLDNSSNNTCANAQTIGLGVHGTNLSNSDKWFKYVNTQSTSLIVKIATCDLTLEDTELLVYKGCSSNAFATSDDFCDLQSAVVFRVQANETIYLRCSNQFSKARIAFVLLEFEDCRNEVLAVLGTNQVANTKIYNWYNVRNNTNRFKKFRASTCDLTTADTYVTLHNNCDEFNEPVVGSDDFCAFQSQLDFVVPANGEVVLNWQNVFTNSSYNWILSEVQYDGGESCESPKAAVIGNNTVEKDKNIRWFEVVNNSNFTRSFRASTCGLTTYDTYCNLYESCNDPQFIEFDDNCITQTQFNFDVEANSKKIMFWSIFGVESRAYDFQLTELTTSLSSNLVGNPASLTIYPTASNGSYQLNKIVEKIIVFDINGNFVYGDLNTNRVDLIEKPSGMYFVKTEDVSGINNFKIVKY